MSGKLRADWELDRSDWRHAMMDIADEAGKDSPCYEAMGSIAWGRFDGEPSATDSKDKAIFGAAFLQGVRYALLNVAQDLGWPEAESLRRINDRIMEMRVARGRR